MMSRKDQSHRGQTALWAVLPLLVVLTLAIAVLSACGGGSNEGSLTIGPSATGVATRAPASTPASTDIADSLTPVPTAAPTSTTAPVTPAPTLVPTPVAPVTVNVTLSEWKVVSSLTTFQTGVPYHVIVTNDGEIPHQAVLGTGPTVSVDPGSSSAVDVTFSQPGSEEFACHLPAHYGLGMHLAVTMQ